VAPAPHEHAPDKPRGGDVFASQRAFLQGKTWWDASARGIVTVAGPDRLTWLHSLTSQDLLGLRPGITTESLILSPQGKIEHSFLVTDDGTVSWLLTEPGHRDAAAAWLQSMKFRMDVVIDTPEDLVIAGLWGTQTVASEAHFPITFRDPWPQVGVGSVGYHQGEHPGSGWDMTYVLWGSDSSGLLENQAPISDQAWEGLSIAAARPSATEVDEKSLPHELDWLRIAVHLNKGCYRGQESVAKVHNLGHPPRRLTLLHLDGTPSLLPDSGDVVESEGVNVGHITRAAWHYELGPIALALLKRKASAADVSVVTREGTIAAAQEVLVPEDAGRAMPRQRLG
jgi:folate-binding protein YgfZ